VTPHERLVVAEKPIESLNGLFGPGERHEAIARDRVLPVGADDELIDRPERIQSVGHRLRAGQRATPIAAREARTARMARSAAG
jgi:hypothetical protein